MLERSAERLRQLVEGDAPVHEVAVALLPDGRRRLDVVLITDLTDDLLQDVLERDEPGRSAELVYDNRDVRGPTLEVAQLTVEGLGLWNVGRRAHQILPAGGRARHAHGHGDEVLRVHGADDVVGC